MTFETIKARTSREMKRGELSACATAVQSSILSAIKFYERRRFWFNEFVDTTITASASSTYTTLSVDVIVIDSMKAVINGRDYPLAKKRGTKLTLLIRGNSMGTQSGIQFIQSVFASTRHPIKTQRYAWLAYTDCPRYPPERLPTQLTSGLMNAKK